MKNVSLQKKIEHAIYSLISRKVTMTCDGIPYHFTHLPYKKIINWLMVESSNFFKPLKPWGFPTRLQIEPSTLCNLTCSLCPVTVGMNRPVGNMNLSTFRKIIDEIGEYIFVIILWDWGEPFMNPDIYQMISYAKQKNIKLVSSTNGHIFAKEKYAQKLVESGLDSIIVAVDGINQKTYEIFRKKGNLKEVLKGIRNIVIAKKRLSSKTPFINFRFIAMRQNEHEIPSLVEFGRSLGVDAFSIKTFNPYCSGPGSDEENNLSFLPKNQNFHRFSIDSKTKNRIRRQKNPCRNVWFHPVIHWDGKVCPCTFDSEENYVFGNINFNKFMHIWRGKPIRTFRRHFRKNYRKLDICSECSFAYVGGSIGTETIAKVYFYNEP